MVTFLCTIDFVMCHSALLSSKHQSSFENIDNQQLQEMCQLCLQQFNSCMFYTATNQETSLVDNNDNNSQKQQDETITAILAFLSDDLVFKLTLLVLMTIEQLKLKKLPAPTGSQNHHYKAQLNVYFTFVAFAMVFFSHIVNHTMIRFQESLLTSHTNRVLEKVKLNYLEDLENEEEKEVKFLLKNS